MAYAAVSSRQRGYWAVGVGWLMAVALHSVWNYTLAARVSRLALAYAALCAVFVVLLIAVIMDRRRIIALLRRYLREYAPTGIIAGPDVAMPSSLRDRPQARQWARLYCGVAGLREMSEYQPAATELGLLHRRAERGLVDDVSFGWWRDRLLAGMKTATRACWPGWPARRGRHGRRTARHASGRRQPCLRPPPPGHTGLRPSRVVWTDDGAGPGQ